MTVVLLLATEATSLSMTAVIASEAESVLLVVEAHAVGHALPLVVEGTSLVGLNATVQVVALRWATSSANALMHNFSALSIHHAFMSHLLVPISRVFVHLVALGDTISVAKRSLRLRLISLLVTILHRSHLLHLHEATLAWPSTHAHWLSH